MVYIYLFDKINILYAVI